MLTLQSISYRKCLHFPVMFIQCNAMQFCLGVWKAKTDFRGWFDLYFVYLLLSKVEQFSKLPFTIRQLMSADNKKSTFIKQETF